MCYRDMTFCTYGPLCKASGTCNSVLTDKVQADADAWWGKPGAPIMVYADFPSCFVRFFETGEKV